MIYTEFSGKKIKIEVRKAYKNGNINIYITANNTLMDSCHISNDSLKEFFDLVQKTFYFIQTTCEKQVDGTWRVK